MKKLFFLIASVSLAQTMESKKRADDFLSMTILYSHRCLLHKEPIASVCYEISITSTGIYTGSIKSLFVHPNHRRKGYAKYLVLYTLHNMQQRVAPHLVESVCAENLTIANFPAYSLFQKLGFHCEPTKCPHLEGTSKLMECCQKFKEIEKAVDEELKIT